MLQENKPVLGDVSAIKEKGASYLYENYYWPVSDDEFKKFIKFTHNEYLKIIRSIDDQDIYNIAIVELSFVAKLQQIFHYNFVRNYAKDNNLELITGEISKDYYYPDWHSLSRYYKYLKPAFGKTKRFFRRVIKNILFNKHISIGNYASCLKNVSNVVGIGSYDNLKEEFIIKKGVFCDHVDYFDLIPKSDLFTSNQLDGIRKRIECEVITPYLNKINNNSNFVKNIDFNLIQKAWESRFSDLSKLYLNIFNSKKKSILLVTELSNPIHKIITVAYQQSGSKVYCFHHGNDTAVITHTYGHDITSAHCMNYVVPSHGILTKYQKVYSELPTKYFSTESVWYKNIFNNSTCKLNHKVNKIMLIGFPLNLIRYVDGASNFFYSRIDLEYRLIVFLKNLGYYIIYKTHPDRLNEAKGLYDNIADDIISESFESVTNKADCFLFTNSSTTTFGYALLMKKPILLLDFNSNMLDKGSYDLLRKRVKMIPAFVNNSTRVVFDKKTISNALLDMIDIYNESYIENMFFPTIKDSLEK